MRPCGLRITINGNPSEDAKHYIGKNDACVAVWTSYDYGSTDMKGDVGV